MIEKLSVLQARFVFELANLILYAHAVGYTVTLGRGFVTPKENAADGGIDGSLHTLGLAQDLNFFKDGVYLTKTEDLKIFGDRWKRNGPDYAWGGDFQGKNAGDANHFSYAYGGRK